MKKLIFTDDPADSPNDNLEGATIRLTAITCQIKDLVFCGHVPAEPVLFVPVHNSSQGYLIATVQLPPVVFGASERSFSVTVRFAPKYRRMTATGRERITENQVTLSGPVGVAIKNVHVSVDYE